MHEGIEEFTEGDAMGWPGACRFPDGSLPLIARRIRLILDVPETEYPAGTIQEVEVIFAPNEGGELALNFILENALCYECNVRSIGEGMMKLEELVENAQAPDETYLSALLEGHEWGLT